MRNRVGKRETIKCVKPAHLAVTPVLARSDEAIALDDLDRDAHANKDVHDVQDHERRSRNLSSVGQRLQCGAYQKSKRGFEVEGDVGPYQELDTVDRCVSSTCMVMDKMHTLPKPIFSVSHKEDNDPTTNP